MKKYQVTTAASGSVLVDTVEQLVAVLSVVGTGDPFTVLVATVDVTDEKLVPVPAEDFFR